jgi:SAM-dependent methyltransferase
VAKWLRRGSAKPLFGGPTPPVASKYFLPASTPNRPLLPAIPGDVVSLDTMFLLNYTNLIDPLFRDVRRFTPVFSGMKTGEKVIDVCCGTGAQVMEYGRRGIDATGIDLDPNMIATAMKSKTKNHLGNISFQLGDAAALPFADGFFDYASISLALHDKEKPLRQKIVSEMKRVVKRGGTLVFIDYNVPLPLHIWAITARIIEYSVGGSHYRAFKEYLAHDGINGVLEVQGLKEEGWTCLKSGLLAAVKVTNS